MIRQEMLALVHMQEFAKRKPHQLSGGQRQRVALARSLAKRPKLLLLDEPMGALDKKLRDRMQLEVVDILERVGVTCVMVTHDQEEAMTMAGRIAIMNRGKFVQIGEPGSSFSSRRMNSCLSASLRVSYSYSKNGMMEMSSSRIPRRHAQWIRALLLMSMLTFQQQNIG